MPEKSIIKKICAIVCVFSAAACMFAAGCGNDSSSADSGSSGGEHKRDDEVRVTSVNFTVVNAESRAEYEKLPLTEVIENAQKSTVTLTVKTESASSIVSGTAIAVTDDGKSTYVVASHKALAGAESITASANGVYSSESENSAEPLEFSSEDGTLSPVGTDPQTDVCVIRLDGYVPAAVICDDPDMAVGETVVAVGNLLGTKTILSTRGIISAESYSASAGEGKTSDYILTDAYSKSGSGGGVFYERGGYLAGIITSLTEFGQTDITCAIPSSVIKEVAAAIIKDGYVAGRYKLGISVSDNRYSWGITTGVEVTELAKDGSFYADGNGLKTGDILRSVTFGGTTYTINRAETFLYYIYNADLKVDDVIYFQLERKRTQITVPVIIKQYNYFDYN